MCINEHFSAKISKKQLENVIKNLNEAENGKLQITVLIEIADEQGQEPQSQVSS